MTKARLILLGLLVLGLLGGMVRFWGSIGSGAIGLSLILMVAELIWQQIMGTRDESDFQGEM